MLPETLFYCVFCMMIKMKAWRRQHKWVGLFVSFFLVMFCISGIILNHRTVFLGVNVNRNLLPPAYHFRNWDKGLLRGTVPCRINGKEQVLLYGYEGCFLTDSVASSFADFNKGLPDGCDLRSIRAVVQLPGGQIWAAGQFGCYELSGTTAHEWQSVHVPLSDNERISDLYVYGDTLLVVGRSYIYAALPPYKQFHRMTLKAADTYDGRVSLFRMVWQLHNGELFGSLGRMVIDVIALILVFLCVSGWLYWLLPKSLRWRRRIFRWHDKVGVRTIILTVFIAFTGWCLRPPVLIALVQNRVPAIPGTALSSTNPWHDNLRMLRYDRSTHEWLLAASDGFYQLRSLHAVPEKLANTPPVSVMGVNVWHEDNNGDWLVGSFSGMYRWNRITGRITDYTTGKPASLKPGPPFGLLPVAGFTADFHKHSYIADYEKGCDFAPMPSSFRSLPMSLWDVALEIHSGRIYVLDNVASMIFVFIAGLLVVWVLWSGYRLRIKSPKKKKNVTKGDMTT